MMDRVSTSRIGRYIKGIAMPYDGINWPFSRSRGLAVNPEPLDS
jgi:hypothetical protein